MSLDGYFSARRLNKTLRRAVFRLLGVETSKMIIRLRGADFKQEAGCGGLGILDPANANLLRLVKKLRSAGR
jgi:hypothetical protein